MIQIEHLIDLLEFDRIYKSLRLRIISIISKLYFNIYARPNLSFLKLALLSPKYEKYVFLLLFHNCIEIYKVSVSFHRIFHLNYKTYNPY